METRKIDPKNYTKITIIFVMTILFVLVVRTIYHNSNEYKLRNSILHNIINEAKADNIYNYITENDNSLVYICASNNKTCRSLDNELKDYIPKVPGLFREMVYLNIRDVSNKTKYLKEFSSKYRISSEIKEYPTFVLFKDGKVEKVVTESDIDIMMNNLKNIVDRYDLGE